MTTNEKLDKLSEEHTQLIYKIIELWREEVFLTWRWWLGVFLSVAVWVVWFKIRKKDSSQRLMTAGYFVMGFSMILDSIGVQIGLWAYRYEVLPFIPAYLPWDLALMPVIIMILIQIYPNVSPSIKAIIFGVLTSFIGEPLIVWLDIYNPIHWKMWYSLPIYIIIYLTADKITRLDSYRRIEE
jgi:hypothetical protein